MLSSGVLFFFFFNDTATTEIYTLSLHDALPISWSDAPASHLTGCHEPIRPRDRKSTRLNSSHDQISYAVFCLKKKNKIKTETIEKNQHPNKKTDQQHTNTI